jgi:hypothetical protein
MNAVGHGGEQALTGKTLGNAKDPKQKNEQDAEDSYQFPEEILIHDGTKSKCLDYAALFGFSFFFRSRNLSHGGLGHFQDDIVGRNPQVNGIILECHDRSPQATAGHDLVASFQAVEHGRPFLLPALLGKNQQKVKDAKNKNQWSDT